MRALRARAFRAGGRVARAFSLVEVVLVLFLTGLILLIVSRLTQRTFTTLRFLEEKAETVQSATLGIERLSSELREAVQVSGYSPLTFRKVDPSAPYALDQDLDSSADSNPGDPPVDSDFSTWKHSYASDAFDRDQLGTVTYSLSASMLTRTAQKGGRSLTTQVATHVNSFVAIPAPNLGGQATASNVVQVTLSLQEQRRVVTFSTIVVIPGMER